ncbi:hypothetical protein [Paraburkholderia sp. SIMBA_054]|uniref:hypothetical protein n=1 Tax=Paraburkholderia sp. SIMBA_054 TaxID=3085795 RepID=UPI0039794B5F
MLAALIVIAATLAALGAAFLVTIIQVNFEAAEVRNLALHTLTQTSALQYVGSIEALLTAKFSGILAVSIVCAIAYELAWTVRRARRLMPPVEFISAQLRDGVRAA